MEQVLLQPGFARPASGSHTHFAGGSARSYAHSVLIAGLFASGLALWLIPSDAIVLWSHVLGGVVVTALLAGWLWRHVAKGLGKSPRRAFRLSSWGILALWLGLFGTGLAMALPAAFWLAGTVWFPLREVTELLSWLHFWLSLAGMIGLVLHLGQRHWLWGQA